MSHTNNSGRGEEENNGFIIITRYWSIPSDQRAIEQNFHENCTVRQKIVHSVNKVKTVCRKIAFSGDDAVNDVGGDVVHT